MSSGRDFHYELNNGLAFDFFLKETIQYLCENFTNDFILNRCLRFDGRS